MRVHSLAAVVLFLIVSSLARSDEATVELDRAQIASDETVALRFSFEAESISSNDFKFEAPDFHIVNEYESSFNKSFLDASEGKFKTSVTRSVTRVLRPKRQGVLSIKGIETELNGVRRSHPNLTLHVIAGGAGTPPSRFSQGGQGGLRGSKPDARTNRPFFVQAEVDKSEVYKGERIIVSYYLYTKVSVGNLQVDKFPVFTGFLREDLEIPVMDQNGLSKEVVVMGGRAMSRALLARYAAFPLKEGRLPIDQMSIKAAYNEMLQDLGDEEDPINQMMGRLMQRQTLRTASSTSESITVQVKPLPIEGRPATFTGGIGQFDVRASADRQTVKVGDMLTFSVVVEGNGNLGAVELPKIELPEGLKLYDNQGRMRNSRAGTGERVFDYLIVAGAPGAYRIPAVEIAFFDPVKREYYTRSTSGFDLQAVGEAQAHVLAAQSPSAAKTSSESGESSAWAEQKLLRMGAWLEAQGSLLAKGAALLLAFCLVMVGLFFVFRRARQTLAERASRLPKRPRSLQGLKKVLALPPKEAWERVESLSFELIDAMTGLGSRAMARNDLGMALKTQFSVPDYQVEELLKTLEQAEAARFAPSGIAGQSQDAESLKRAIRIIEELTVTLEARVKITDNASRD